MKYDIQSLKEKLVTLNVRPNKKLGQNFLINQTICEQIAQVALQENAQKIIEVGPGLGALTDYLQVEKEKLILIELDRSFVEYWKEREFCVVHGDALQLDWTPWLENAGLISNLPYQISSSLVIDRSIDVTQLDFMVLMFQKEVGQRMLAKPKTADYSLLSVMAQVFWSVEFVMEVGPKDFFPPPQIASRVLLFRKKDSGVSQPQKFLKFVKEAFKQRRKFLVSNLTSFIEKEKSRAFLKEMGFLETVRPEDLSPQDFVTLFNKLKQTAT